MSEKQKLSEFQVDVLICIKNAIDDMAFELAIYGLTTSSSFEVISETEIQAHIVFTVNTQDDDPEDEKSA